MGLSSTPASLASVRGDATIYGRKRVPRRRRRGLRKLRIAVAILAVALVPIAYSYTTAMLQPSSLPLSIRTIEWIRQNGGAGIISYIERQYYSWTAPAKGGPALTALPPVGDRLGGNQRQTGFGTSDPHSRAAQLPPRIVPVIHPALVGEGVWRPVSSDAWGRSVMVTVFRPDPSYPRVVAYAAWIDTRRTQLALYPGRYEPPGSGGPRGPMMVPYDQRWRLLATFNSGFTYSDGQGGFWVDGHSYTPLVDGKATLLAYRDGHVAIAPWRGGPRPPGDVVLARQNASMIVRNGRVPADVFNGDQQQWGLTLGNAILVWRSAIGIDRHGNLIYAAADYRTVGSLAKMMIEAGAVQAMELDINAEWPTFNYYRGHGARSPVLFVPNYQQSAGRYLVPDDRDFFAVYARTTPGNPGTPLR